MSTGSILDISVIIYYLFTPTDLISTNECLGNYVIKHDNYYHNCYEDKYLN